MSEPTEVRAERLRVLLALHQGADSLGSEGCKEAFRAGLGPTSGEDLALINSATDEDKQLGLACFAVERDLRRRGWNALERLAVLLDGYDVNATMEAVSREHALALGRVVRELGWIGAPPAEGDDDGHEV
jgi:hypothetical protein